MALPKEQIDGLKMFVNACKANPAILHEPQLDFYKDWLISLGAKLPPAPAWEKPEPTPPEPEPTPEPKPTPAAAAESSSESSDVESDIELNLEFVTGAEAEAVPTLPSIEKEVSEEDGDKADDKRREAMMAMSDGELDKALAAFAEAIELNPVMAALFAKRAQLFVRMGRPAAAVQDCDRALELNANSALAYKQRGRANRLLGKIDEAYKDLGKGQQIDYDDDTDELQKSLKDDVHKVQEHNNKRNQRNKEKELKRRKKEVAKRKAEAQKAYEEEQKRRSAPGGGFSGGMPGGFPGGMPGGFPGGMPGGFPGGMPGGRPGGGMPGAAGGGMPADIGNILSDPELLQAFQDPEVSTAFMEVSQDPSKIEKYKSNSKVMKVIEKLQSKFGGGAGAEEPSAAGAEEPSAAGAGADPSPSAAGAAFTGPSDSSNDLD